MFNWQAEVQSTSSSTTTSRANVIVQSFWIYWAVSIPLTLIVLLGWRIWWHYQKSYYTDQYLHVTERSDSETIDGRTRGKYMSFFSARKTKTDEYTLD